MSFFTKTEGMPRKQLLAFAILNTFDGLLGIILFPWAIQSKFTWRYVIKINKQRRGLK